MAEAMDSLKENIKLFLHDKGWKVVDKSNVITASRRVIAFTWLLGRKTVRLDLSCQIDAAQKVVTYKETASESTIGIAPPSFSISKSHQSGTTYTEDRRDGGVGGGGEMHYGEARQFLEAICRDAGYRFETKIGFVSRS